MFTRCAVHNRVRRAAGTWLRRTDGAARQHAGNLPAARGPLPHGSRARLLATTTAARFPQAAGPLFDSENSDVFIPQYCGRTSRQRRVLILCTGGTLTMMPDAGRGGGLAPVEGALRKWVTEDLDELNVSGMPETVVHEYKPLMDSSDMGPADWSRIAGDIAANYLHFDGFVVCMGTDTMAYAASALSFMLENLGKPVIFTGSQIPLHEPFNDARRNLIMSIIFAGRDTINEVAIFFHDRLIRGCRATKVNTHRLMAFKSPNLEPLARVGISIDEAQHVLLPQARGALRVHREMDTRLLTLRLVPGFDDAVLGHVIDSSIEKSDEGKLRGVVLQLYGTGNLPSAKQSMFKTLRKARDHGIIVTAVTQCPTGSVMLGKYAVGHALKEAGVVSGRDMTMEAAVTKLAYLFGRGDMDIDEIADMMPEPLRGEVSTPGRNSTPNLARPAAR
eukprot:TRINITY_DN103232_c0_g1_i1.p1 TRINITY_DN103232_c0_g1~~TRINITY_DN103232_c0_g1_i1.p1  ORF type:complete len:447 (-),score=75.33 TRINITY_DN103232_c0_g1_i1:120-1460(-)